MELIQEPTTAVSAPPAPPSREAVEQEIADVSARRAAFLHDGLAAAEAAEKAEGEAHHAQLVMAIRKNQPAPPRESLDKAEAAVLQAKERLAAFDTALVDLRTERVVVINRARAAEREQNVIEMAQLKAVRPGLEQALRDAQLALSENAGREQSLLGRNQALAYPYRET